MHSLTGEGVPSALAARAEAAKAKTLADRAYLLIKADIIDCELAPGEMFSTQELNVRFGMGMSAIRAAMERLVAGHWVEPVPNRGYRIDSITLKDVIELYDLAEAISPQLSRLSCGRINAIYPELVSLNEVTDAKLPPATPEDEQRILQASGRILRAVRLASGNAYAIALTQQITERLDRVIAARRHYSDQPIDLRRNFMPLIEALRNNDPDAADRASLANVRRMKSLIVDQILRQPQFFGSQISPPRARGVAARAG